MNLDFGLDPVFSWYVVLLCLSGIVMVALAAIKADEQSVGARALGAVAGLGFLGYGIYLGFIFDGGSYMMFFQAFILPAVLIFNFVRTLLTNHQTQPQPYTGAPNQQYPAGPTQPQPYVGGPTQTQPYQGTPGQAPYQGGYAQPQPGQPYPAQPQPEGYSAGPTQPAPTQPGPTQPS